MNRVLSFLPLAVLFFSLSACMKTNVSNECDFDACAFKAPETEVNAVMGYLSAQGITDATKHCSGLFYKIVTPGTGPQPNPCSDVTVRYKGKFTNGSVFDQTTTAEGISFNLGSLITGWRSGIPLVGAGGKIILYIPPALAYKYDDIRDSSGSIVIPRNSILVFEIELLSVR
jgi:FKBP-type peptidyl-prolyl cis-trans isomerase FkpA